MAEMTSDEIVKAVEEVIQKAAKDPATKELALKDPAAAVKKVTGKEIPQGLKLELVEQGKDMMVSLNVSDAQLSDEQLDAVAGGATCKCGRTNVLRLG